MTRRKNQQHSALLRLVILPGKAWFAHGEDASTTNATMHASTLPMHLLVLTGIGRDRIRQSIGQPSSAAQANCPRTRRYRLSPSDVNGLGSFCL